MSAARSDAEELPLLIQDYSCANTFEEHVRVIEKYLSGLFDREALLHSFLFPSPSSLRSTRSSPSLNTKEGSRATADAADSAPGKFHWETEDDADGASSLASLLDDTAMSSHQTTVSRSNGGGLAFLSRVFSQTMTLYSAPAVSSSQAAAADLDVTVAVEVHVRDAAHPITQQYCTPLFFLIRKVAASASYRESETTYLLSLLSTAVRQVLRQLRNGAVLRISTTAACSTAALADSRGAQGSWPAADALPSPFLFPSNCAPCFAPAGDSYKQTFVGVAPPLPTVGALPRMSVPPEMTAAEWTLLHQRSVTTRFLSDAFATPPAQCRTLADFIDLFQLHVGQHSRIRSDDFDGICVSLWKAYTLPVPWKFYPHGVPTQLELAAAKKLKKQQLQSASMAGDDAALTDGAAVAGLTWDGVLKRENSYTQLLSGSFTHAFGAPAPPLKHIAFFFQWNQLQDTEAHEPSGRPSPLDPFQFAPPSAPVALSTAAQASQRKCCITARVVLRDDDHIQGGVSQRLRDVVEESYLNPSAHQRLRSPAPPQPRSYSRDGDDAPSLAATRTGHADSAAGSDSSESGEGAASHRENAQLDELAAQIVDWTGATVTVQESLLRRFARPTAAAGAAEQDNWENSDDDDNDGEEEGCAGQTHGGVLAAAAARRGGLAVARRMRHLWGEWEAHQQHFPLKTDSAFSNGSDERERGDDTSAQGGGERVTTLEAAEREAAAVAASIAARRDKAKTPRPGGGALPDDKDVRHDYFPDSFFARFAFVCTTQVPHTEDVQELWLRSLDRLRGMLNPPQRAGGADTRKQSWQRMLDCLALPRADPPVDLSRPLLTQKLQLLAFALYSLVHPAEHLFATLEGAVPAEEDSGGRARGRAARGSAVEPPRLLTHGEPLIAPAPLPTPPTTTDAVLQRAMELNTQGAAAVETATAAWLCGDALYNDMCLFLYVNKAHEGRVVRFPDFVHWHSPRDFVSPPPSSSPAPLDDNAYLSDRMKDQPDGRRGSTHVWWALWRRATPRSRDEILQSLFDPLEQASQVLQWLTAMPLPALLLELSSASISNALHRMLCHRFFLGDAEGRGAALRGGGSPTRIPASPRLRTLHRVALEKSASLTKDLEAASAILSNRSSGPASAAAGGVSVMEAMEAEMLRSFVANALHELGEIESALCTAVAVHYLCGFSPDPEAAATVRALGSPCAPSSVPLSRNGGGAFGSGVQMRTVTVSTATWSSCLARQFTRPESRVVQESLVRLTCMAERPLNTYGCLQQLVVHQDASNTLRMALALSQEVV